MKPTLSVIGAGRVGKVIARLLNEANLVDVVAVLNRSEQSTQSAVDFIGAGAAASGIGELPKSDIYMVSVKDDAIATCASELASARDLSDVTVFHCSGALPSSVLGQAQSAGASIASVHPNRTFSDLESAYSTFEGSFCGFEGDQSAVAILQPLFEGIGGRSFSIDASAKTIYHAANVFSANYFRVLVDVGLRCYERAGIDRQTGLEMMKPLLGGVVESVLRQGPVKALSGPVARGDAGVVERQLEALSGFDDYFADLYALLGQHAVGMSKEAGNASPEGLAEIERLFSTRFSPPNR